jgi:hypothetical protein
MKIECTEMSGVYRFDHFLTDSHFKDVMEEFKKTVLEDPTNIKFLNNYDNTIDFKQSLTIDSLLGRDDYPDEVFSKTNHRNRFANLNVLDLKDHHQTRTAANEIYLKLVAILPQIKSDLADRGIKFKQASKRSFYPSGHFIYPPGGGMPWHTNNDFPGQRIYISHVDSPEQSAFRYIQNDKIIDDFDTGWNLRVFEVGKSKPLWHSVHTQVTRLSLGFLVDFNSLDECSDE